MHAVTRSMASSTRGDQAILTRPRFRLSEVRAVCITRADGAATVIS